MPREVPDVEAERRRGREGRALATSLAAQRDHQVRLNSVARDFQLGLPTSVPQPDGEEFPRRCHMQLRSQDQSAEIVKGFITGPPNKTINNSSGWGDSFGGGGGLEVKAGAPSKSNSCSCLVVPEGKSHSTGQLNSWNFLKTSSTSSGAGKSPPHARSAKCHFHSRKGFTSSKHKGGSLSGSTTLPPNSTATCTPSPTTATPTPRTTPPPAAPHSHKPSFTEKLSSIFSDKGPPPNNNQTQALSAAASPGMFARLLSDETKSKSKSSKVKGQPQSSAAGWCGLKGDVKKIPPTQAQVYVVIPKEEGLRSRNGAGLNRTPSPMPQSHYEGRISHESLGFSLTEEDEGGPQGSESGMQASDRNGNGAAVERERAYSDSMLRTERSSLFRSADMSESRMSLCYEGEDTALNGTTATSTEEQGTEGGLTTEPDGPPSMSRSETIQEGPSSFQLYQHHHHLIQDHDQESKYSSSMNVSTTPPPGTDFT